VSIEILTDRDTNQSVMFCNTSDIAFGPVFGEDEDPQEFLDWIDDKKMIQMGAKGIESLDVRGISGEYLSTLVDNWRKQVEENGAEASGERHFTEPGAWSGGFARNN